MITLIISLLFNSINPIVCALDSAPTYYARVMFEQVYLYKTSQEDNSIQNIYFELPKTYFVLLTGEEGEFYKAKYLNFNGYVKKDSVQATSSTPANPFLQNIFFRVYSNLSENLWSAPSVSSNLISTIPHLNKNLEYFGKIQGESLIDGRTNIWYYCKFNNDYGYVYSDFCDEFSTYSSNTEMVNYIANPSFQIAPEPTNTIPQNSNAAGIVVLILAIPAIIFVFMLLKSSRWFKTTSSSSSEVVDY